MNNEIFNRLQNIEINSSKLVEYLSTEHDKKELDNLAEDYFLANKRRYTNELNELLSANMWDFYS